MRDNETVSIICQEQNKFLVYHFSGKRSWMAFGVEERAAEAG